MDLPQFQLREGEFCSFEVDKRMIGIFIPVYFVDNIEGDSFLLTLFP
jgi:hypothetical protein